MEYPKNVAFTKYASVILGIAAPKPLDYGIPQEQISLIKPGVRVKVTVRGHLRDGIVVAIKETSPFPRVLPIQSLLPEEEQFQKDLFELALWMTDYYNAPINQVLKCMVPSTVRKPIAPKQQYYLRRAKSKQALVKICSDLRLSFPTQAKVIDLMLNVKDGMFLTELVEKAAVSKSPIETLVRKGHLLIDKVRVNRSPLVGEEYFKTSPKVLNPDQSRALAKIVSSVEEGRFETHLLFGITGSGKTEVYLQAIEKALRKNLGTIMLVPEISITPQTIESFRTRFDDEIGILHHRLSRGERYDEWHRIRRGEARIVIGARSALFSPVQNLGLIIVDEEHDTAYKQNEEMPSYHARDVAVMRGKIKGCTVVLGTATPSLESYYNASRGKYTLSKLSSRATQATLPKVTIIDMKREMEKAKGYTSFSQELLDGIEKRVALGEQSLLFLNRRGYHTSRHCSLCGYIFKCPHCDLALTFHRSEKALSCHLCGHQLSSFSTACPKCDNHQTLKYRGVGTEQIEKALNSIFPEVRTLRIDRDTTRHKGAHERFFRHFSTGKADVLIGTQMIAKGLHFPAVTLVAILNADAGLHIPDFRSSERVFQLITQVAGRSGRGNLPGEVIFQTHMPDNATIKLAASQDYESFFQTEIKSRELFGYPPFTHLIKLTFSGKDAVVVQKTAETLRCHLVRGLVEGYKVHPVVASGYPKIKEFFRFQCLIRGGAVYPANALLRQLLTQHRFPKEVKIHIDVDPLSTFF